METRTKTGAWLSVIGALIGIAGAFAIFVNDWKPLHAAQVAAGRADEAMIVMYILPALNDLMMIGGVVWAMAAYGFCTGEKWAWSLGVTGSVMTLVGAFFWTVPAMSKGVTPTYMAVFLPNLLFYLVLILYVKPVDKWVAVFTLFAGITYVLCFMNGVAGTDHMILGDGPHYVATQRLAWAGSAGWAVTVVGMLHRREWARALGIASGILGVVSGVPLAYASTIELGRFSMFIPAPALSLILLVILVIPSVKAWYSAYCRQGEADMSRSVA